MFGLIFEYFIQVIFDLNIWGRIRQLSAVLKNVDEIEKLKLIKSVA